MDPDRDLDFPDIDWSQEPPTGRGREARAARRAFREREAAEELAKAQAMPQPDPWPASLKRMPELALSYALCLEYADGTEPWADQYSQEQQVRLWDYRDPNVDANVIIARGEHPSWVMFAQHPYRYALIYARRPEQERSAYVQWIAAKSQRTKILHILAAEVEATKDDPTSPPSANNAGDAQKRVEMLKRHQDFLKRIIPIVVSGAAYLSQKDAAKSINQDPRHVRRQMSDLGYRSWSEFVADLRSGKLSPMSSDVLRTRPRCPSEVLRYCVIL